MKRQPMDVDRSAAFIGHLFSDEMKRRVAALLDFSFFCVSCRRRPATYSTDCVITKIPAASQSAIICAFAFISVCFFHGVKWRRRRVDVQRCLRAINTSGQERVSSTHAG